MRLNIAQVIGLNTDQKAAQTVYQQSNGDTFFAVLDLACDDAFTKGRQALSELSDFYFDFEGTPADKLNATFSEAKKKFEGMEFSMLLAAFSGKILYLISQGSMDALLQRGDKRSKLLVGADGQLVSGFIQEEDKLLLSTSTLIDFLVTDLDKALRLSPQVFEEEITDRIAVGGEEKRTMAGLSVMVLAEEQAAIPSLKQEAEGVLATYSATSRLGIENLKLLIQSTLKKSGAILIKIPSFLPRGGKGRLMLAVALIMVIALGIGFKIKTSRDAQREQIFTLALKESKDNFEAAKGLSSLSPAEAKTRLERAKEKIGLALSLKSENGEALELKQQIEQESDSILKQSEVSDFPLFLDLDLVRKDFQAQNLSLSAGKLLLLDPNLKSLITIDLTKKSNQILAGSEQLGEAQLASLNGNMAFVYSQDKGILRVDTLNQKVTTVSKADEAWGQALDISGFASNVYLLDRGDPSTGSTGSPQAGPGQVWKYIPTVDGYSGKREYLTSETQADFAGSIRMQIESSIYVLKSGGEMLRFTRGVKDHFAYEGLERGVKDPKSFFVSSDTEDLYILDSGNSRLLIVSKTGSFKGQITGSKFATSSDLVVDEKGKKVYLLEGSKIYQVDLK